jgi:MFS family permease
VLLALLAAEFGAGLGVMMLDISLGSVFAAAIPDRLRSRVAGAYMVVNYGVRPLGALAAGALATAIGTRETLWIATLGGALAALWLVSSPLPRLRALPEPEEARLADAEAATAERDADGGLASTGEAA